MVKKFSMELAGRTLTVEVGRVAATGAGAFLEVFVSPFLWGIFG